MLGCSMQSSAVMDFLQPFSAAGRVALGLVCLSSLPFSLPDEMQGGGIEVDVPAAAAIISSMVSAGQGT